MVFETLTIHKEGGVQFVEIAAPPMNLLGPQLVRELVSLHQQAEADDTIRVLVFKSAELDYFISHVDVTRIKENREAARLIGEASIALLLRHLSTCCLVSIANRRSCPRSWQRVRAGLRLTVCWERVSDLQSVRASVRCDPWRGRRPAPHAPHGPSPRARSHVERRRLDAELAERYGWINRALPANALSDFVNSLPHRIERFPAAGQFTVKERVNAIALPRLEDMLRDSDLFVEGFRNPEAQTRTQAAMKLGFQTRDTEMALARILGDLANQ